MFGKIRRAEFLMDNFLDKEIISTFLPFSAVQWLYLLPKYRIYESLIVYNSHIVDCLSFLSALFVGAMFICHYMFTYPSSAFSTVYITVATFDTIFNITMFITSYFFNFFYRKLNVELVLNFQRIFKMFKSNKYDNLFLFNIVTWLSFASYVLAFVLWFFILFIKDVSDMYQIILLGVSVYLDLTIIYACRITGLIKIVLRLWISEVSHITKLAKPINRSLKSNNIMKQDWDRILQAYQTILETYEIYKKIFNILVS